MVNLFGVNLLYPSSTVVKFPVFVVGDPFPWSSTGVNLRLRLRQDLEIRGFSEINFGRSAHAAGFYAVSRYGRGTANWRNIRRYIHTISIYGYGKLYSGGTGALEVYTKSIESKVCFIKLQDIVSVNICISRQGPGTGVRSKFPRVFRGRGIIVTVVNRGRLSSDWLTTAIKEC